MHKLIAYILIQICILSTENFIDLKNILSNLFIFYQNGKMVNKPFQLSSQGGRAARFSPSSDCLGLGYSDGKVYLWSITSESIIL